MSRLGPVTRHKGLGQNQFSFSSSFYLKAPDSEGCILLLFIILKSFRSCTAPQNRGMRGDQTRSSSTFPSLVQPRISDSDSEYMVKLLRRGDALQKPEARSFRMLGSTSSRKALQVQDGDAACLYGFRGMEPQGHETASF